MRISFERASCKVREYISGPPRAGAAPWAEELNDLDKLMQGLCDLPDDDLPALLAERGVLVGRRYDPISQREKLRENIRDERLRVLEAQGRCTPHVRAWLTGRKRTIWRGK